MTESANAKLSAWREFCQKAHVYWGFLNLRKDSLPPGQNLIRFWLVSTSPAFRAPRTLRNGGCHAEAAKPRRRTSLIEVSTQHSRAGCSLIPVVQRIAKRLGSKRR